MEEESRRFYNNIAITNWNVNGVNSNKGEEKLKYLKKISNKLRASIITLQETHTYNNDNLITQTFNKHYWIFNNYTAQERGLATGVCFPFVPSYKHPIVAHDSSFLIIWAFLEEELVQIANIYLPIGRQREAWVEMLRVLDKKLPVIVVGDFNIDSEEDEMKRMEEEVMGVGVVRIRNPSPTHYRGRTIDHVFITSSLVPADFYIYSYPPFMKDHYILLFKTLHQHV